MHTAYQSTEEFENSDIQQQRTMSSKELFREQLVNWQHGNEQTLDCDWLIPVSSQRVAWLMSSPGCRDIAGQSLVPSPATTIVNHCWHWQFDAWMKLLYCTLSPVITGLCLGLPKGLPDFVLVSPWVLRRGFMTPCSLWGCQNGPVQFTGWYIVQYNATEPVYFFMLGGSYGIRPVKTDWWDAGMVTCLGQGAYLHKA